MAAVPLLQAFVRRRRAPSNGAPGWLAALAMLAIPTLGATTVEAQGIRGTVRDSLADGVPPLAGAEVLVDGGGVSRLATTDARGRFRVDGLPAGRYRLAVAHPMLARLRLPAPVAEVEVRPGRRPARAALATPAPGTLLAALCGPEVAGDSALGALLVRVRRPGTAADGGAPVPRAAVSTEWSTLAFGAGAGPSRTVVRPRVLSDTAGLVRLCGVPLGMTLPITVERVEEEGAEVVAATWSPSPARLAALDLVLADAPVPVGAATTDAVAAPAEPAPAEPAPDAPVRLTGRVVDEAGRAVGGARVRVGADALVADPRGRFAATLAPGRVEVEARALGLRPDGRTLDVAPGAAVTLELRLAPADARLDSAVVLLPAVAVTATSKRLALVGFDRRRRSGRGRYFDQAEIERRNPVRVVDLFRDVLGFTVAGDRILGRPRLSGSGMGCATAILIDGVRVRLDSPGAVPSPVIDFSGSPLAPPVNAPSPVQPLAMPLEAFVDAREVAAIEAYSGVGRTPLELEPLEGSGCGLVAIWTKR